MVFFDLANSRLQNLRSRRAVAPRGRAYARRPVGLSKKTALSALYAKLSFARAKQKRAAEAALSQFLSDTGS